MFRPNSPIAFIVSTRASGYSSRCSIADATGMTSRSTNSLTVFATRRWSSVRSNACVDATTAILLCGLRVMVCTANHSASEGNDMKKIALALIIIASAALQAQSRDHWVGTWATAVVVRPQAPAAPLTLPPTASGQPNACQPAAFGPGPGAGRGNGQAPPAPLNFRNQTLREIVHVSLGGDRVRIVLSN